MKVSLFFDIASPRPWSPEREMENFERHLKLLEVADQVGFHAVWVTEHHFMEEYSAASAPEVFLGAASQRTKRLRLGHGIMHLPPQINHPARAAERIATLDVLSNGRVEFGSGEASSAAELHGFGVDPGTKRAAWREGIEVAARCMAEHPFTGFQGDFVSMPPREVIPNTVQKPHPPLWMACTRTSTLEVAAELGMGALHFAVAGPQDIIGARELYFAAFADRACPLTPAANPNFLCLGGSLMCAESDALATERATITGGFYGFAISYYFVHGRHRPGQVDLWAEYLRSLNGPPVKEIADPAATAGNRKEWAELAGSVTDQTKASVEGQKAGDNAAAKGMTQAVSGIGSPETITSFLESFEATGVEEICLLVPPGDARHGLESLELMGEHVLPAFIEREELTAAERAKRDAGLVEDALRRYAEGPKPPPLDPSFTFGGPPVSQDGKTAATEIADVLKRAAEVAEQGQ
jgi:alkanesulfonate monooxygenase SsuD/methylene tetrahydromethanopterin reductase-like flavin-dependent oxidoreductase (luciferase family)